MFRIAIVEDEDLYVNQLQEYIQTYQQESGNEIHVQIFRDGEDILENYRGEFDIILMDIQMRFMDGMTAAERIREVDGDVVIMFITNMVNYAIKGYEVDALDYVLKPVTYFSFSQKLNRAIGRVKKRERRSITINISSGIQKLEISDIYYIESEGHTLVYCTRRGEFRSRGKMKEVEETLAPFGFFRSNKGYLVNLKHVDGVKDGCCLVCQKKLLISRSRKNEFLEALSNYMSEVMN